MKELLEAITAVVEACRELKLGYVIVAICAVYLAIFIARAHPPGSNAEVVEYIAIAFLALAVVWLLAGLISFLRDVFK